MAVDRIFEGSCLSDFFIGLRFFFRLLQMLPDIEGLSLESTQD